MMRRIGSEPRPLRHPNGLAALYLTHYGGHYMQATNAEREEWLRREATARRYEVLPKHIFTERLAIARPERGRPALDALLADAAAGAFGAVFVYAPDVLTEKWNDIARQRAIVATLKQTCRVFAGPNRVRHAMDRLGDLLDEHARSSESDSNVLAAEL